MSYRRGLKKATDTSLSKKFRPDASNKRRGARPHGSSKDETDKSQEAGKDDIVCSIGLCKNVAERSLSKDKYEKILKQMDWKVKDDKDRRVHVCKDHYKDLKKTYKKETKLTTPKFARESSPNIQKKKPHLKRLD